MNHKQNRRSFLAQCAKCGGACCALLALNRISRARQTAVPLARQEKPIDLAALAYCGIPQAFCESRCELFKATLENDAELKRAVYDKWEMKNRFGIEFEADKIFCYGCKPGDKPLKVGMAECAVRTCPIAHGMESCVQCGSLASCDKAFWKEWPVAYEHIKKLQARYSTQPGAKIFDIKARSCR
ncbi:MAG: DUF3795 domain-containing protein [Candidatus Aminicenantes bacterium]|nr:DUF3795 domain-containing protein [Candidatus Aminicenantes bacterium]